MRSCTTRAVVRLGVAAAILLVVLPACAQRHCLCDDPEINPKNPGHDGRDSAIVVPRRSPAYHPLPVAARAWRADDPSKERTP
ncbi:MAG: hypothetical protein K8T90_03705 [Planctomycetes bacterium]|nr:hypothetical protein [Planctomycetota bacterium]